MPLTHLEHPEDTILTGDLSVLDAFLAPNDYSVKIDGAPSIVWGTHPETGKFFVGTKSVFNKITPKINYTVEDICRNHPDFELQSILIRCLHCLPREEEVPFSVFQGDFIGFGGYRDYKPNSVSYSFDRVMNGGVVVAPHTYYTSPYKTSLRNMTAKPLTFVLLSGRGADFIQPDAWISEFGATMNIKTMVGFARQMATLVEFVTPKEAELLKKDLNAYIRDGDEVVAEEFANYQLVRLWCLVENIKTEYMKLMRDNFKCDCYLGNQYVDGEGYVMTGEHGTYKLVNRWVFSSYNFNSGKFIRS